MKRSHLSAVAATIATAVAVTACSSSGTTKSNPSTPGSHAASGSTGASAASCKGTPVTGGTLVTGRQNQTLSLNPHHTPGGWGDGEAMNLIYENLVKMDPTGKTSGIVPAIADKWTLAANGLSYTFHIRSNAKWSNGDPVTAADVKYSLDQWSNPKISDWASFSTGYKSSTVVDANDLRIDLSATTGDFLYELAMAGALILPAKLVQSQGAAFFNHPVGSGPFKLDTWNKGSSISFAKNPYYWQAGTPRLNQVVFKFIADDNSRVLALKGGQVQTIDSVPWTDLDSLEKASGIAVDSFPTPSWILLSANQKKPQFKDLKVRQALNAAIDRKAINDKIYGGRGTIPNSFLSKLHYDDGSVPAYEYDLSKAKQLMSQSGFAKGFSATFEFPSGNPAFQSLAAVLQSEWAALGVKLTLRPEDGATLNKNFTGGTYDLMIPYPNATADVPVPDEMAGLYGVPGPTDGFHSSWSDPSIAAMITKFSQTPDDASRAEQWPKIQAAMKDALPALNVLDLPLIKARANTVCDDVTSPIGYDTLLTAWVAK